MLLKLEIHLKQILQMKKFSRKEVSKFAKFTKWIFNIDIESSFSSPPETSIYDYRTSHLEEVANSGGLLKIVFVELSV